ncbi:MULTISPECIES: acyl carrier protein [unclassified Micromonospora]|uniref:acyl carrier protein n=1 Tax=Micromonosporaceae TaxID=28056 RepID=UPI003A858BE7
MEIEDGIRRILNSEIMVESSPDQIGVGDSLRAVHGLDSLAFVELRVQCEDMFGVKISDEDFSPENFHSVQSVAALVRRLAQGQS